MDGFCLPWEGGKAVYEEIARIINARLLPAISSETTDGRVMEIDGKHEHDVVKPQALGPKDSNLEVPPVGGGVMEGTHMGMRLAC